MFAYAWLYSANNHRCFSQTAKTDTDSLKEQSEEDFSAEWTITVHTHAESSELEREESANVYIYLIGEMFTNKRFFMFLFYKLYYYIKM